MSEKKSLPNLVWGVSGQMDCFSSDPDLMVHYGPERQLRVGASRRRGRDGAETEKKKNLQTEKAMAFHW